MKGKGKSAESYAAYRKCHAIIKKLDGYDILCVTAMLAGNTIHALMAAGYGQERAMDLFNRRMRSALEAIDNDTENTDNDKG